MSAPHFEHDEELAGVIDDALDRGWSVADAGAADRLLREEGPDAALHWLERMQIEAELETANDGGKEKQTERLAALIASGTATPPRTSSRDVPVFRAVLAVAAVAIVAAVPLAFLLGDRPGPVVGSITAQSEDARWAGEPRTENPVLRARDRLRLEEGLATVEMLDGTRIDLVAPVAVTTASRSSMSLRTGAARFYVPPEAVGFTLRTAEAEIVDLGTLFEVARAESSGTEVVVRVGRVAVTKLEDDGTFGQTLELTAGRSAAFSADEPEGLVRATPPADWPDFQDRVDRIFGGIRRMSGAVRLAAGIPASLAEGEYATHNHILVVTEATGVPLDTLVDGAEAGVLVDSYLVHFDPPTTSSVPPRGSIMFERPVDAVITSSTELAEIDGRLGSPIRFTDVPHRGLELGELDDGAEITADGRGIEFRLRRTGTRQLDQFRVLVRSDESSAPPTGDASILN